MKQHFHAIFNSYPEVYFLQSRWRGMVFFALMLIHPNVGAAGVIAVLASYAFAQLVGMDRSYLQSGYYTYNPLLVGLAMGSLFKITWLSALFIASAGVLTLAVAVILSSVFMTHFRLPILSLPFVFVSSIAYLASFRYANLPIQPPPEWDLLQMNAHVPGWIAGFFRSFGAVLFAPDVLVGLLFALLVLSSSRILFLLAAAGYYVGVGMRALMFGSFDQAVGDVTNFNSILIAMSIGGVFLIPSLGSYLLAIIAVVLSTLLVDALVVFWSAQGVPVFTLPFNVTCLGAIYLLCLLKHPMVAARIGRTPEETLEDHLANRLRYRGELRTLFLPFSGRWTVWQGFDGKWTHKGNWRHAYDFVITDEQGRTHAGDGGRVEDYYCYNKPVLSPVRGRVARVVDDLADSPIGDPDRSNNWGNCVILEDPRGFFVKISHLAQKSISVHSGDWVERGAVLGTCGNSGYSPQPHIHVQAQATDNVGDGSLSFSFVSFSRQNQYFANDLPEENQQVEPLYPDKRLDRVTNFVLDETQRYEVLRRGKKTGQLNLKVQMATDGTFCFRSDRAVLFFGKHEGTFYFYRIDGDDPWLKLLFVALPRLPLAYREKLNWCDYIPAGLVLTGPKRILSRLGSSLFPSLASVQTMQTLIAPDRVQSVIQARAWRLKLCAEAELDAVKGFSRVQVGHWELKRLKEADSTTERTMS